MALDVHVAYITIIGINSLGQVVNKLNPTTTYRDVVNSSTEPRVAPDPSNPSTGDPNATPPTTYPTIKDYLVREAAAGYKASFISATMIVSYNG